MNLGTCRHARQVQTIETRSSDTGRILSHVDKPERYTCSWLDQFRLPPAVARWSHGLELRSGDCESCLHYQAPELPGMLRPKAASDNG